MLSWVPLAALLLGGAVTAVAPGLPVGVMPISTILSNGFTFASIAMGACISAIVLSLGLPGAERLRRWAREPGTLPGKSALSDLVFVIVWAALAQLLLIMVCVAALLFGGDLPLAPSPMIPSHAFGLWVGLAAFFYAVLELFVVVTTLLQMGVMIIAEEQRAVPE